MWRSSSRRWSSRRRARPHPRSALSRYSARSHKSRSGQRPTAPTECSRRAKYRSKSKSRRPLGVSSSLFPLLSSLFPHYRAHQWRRHAASCGPEFDNEGLEELAIGVLHQTSARGRRGTVSVSRSSVTALAIPRDRYTRCTTCDRRYGACEGHGRALRFVQRLHGWATSTTTASTIWSSVCPRFWCCHRRGCDQVFYLSAIRRRRSASSRRQPLHHAASRRRSRRLRVDRMFAVREERIGAAICRRKRRAEGL